MAWPRKRKFKVIHHAVTIERPRELPWTERDAAAQRRRLKRSPLPLKKPDQPQS